MNKNLWAIVVVVLGLFGGTALLLANRDSFQKLGEPGKGSEVPGPGG